MLRTKEQYHNDLFRMKKNIYIDGKAVGRDDGRLRPGVNVLDITFDVAQNPEWDGLATVESSLTGETINRWAHLPQNPYDLMQIDESKVFPITTPADEVEIRAYFNAGCIDVKPKRNIFSKWAENYALLYNDPDIRKMAEDDVYKRIFSFQVALIGAILNNLDRSEMIQISDRYNLGDR